MLKRFFSRFTSFERGGNELPVYLRDAVREERRQDYFN